MKNYDNTAKSNVYFKLTVILTIVVIILCFSLYYSINNVDEVRNLLKKDPILEDYLLPDGYFQSYPKLAICLNDGIVMKNYFYYESETTPGYDRWGGNRKIVYGMEGFTSIKHEIVYARKTSEGNYIVQTTDEVFSSGIIDGETFENNYSFDEDYMIENAIYAYVKLDAHLYDDNKEKIVQVMEYVNLPFDDNTPTLIGRILERNNEWVKVSLNPTDEEWAWVLKEDLKFDPFPAFIQSFYSFVL